MTREPSGQFPLADTQTRLAVLETEMRHTAAHLSKQDEVLDRLDAKLSGVLTGLSAMRRSSERPAKDAYTINKSTIGAVALFVGGVLHQLFSGYLTPQPVRHEAPVVAPQQHNASGAK